MLYTLWSLFNLVALFFFLFLCFRATKLLREKKGIWAAAFFVFGLFSIAGTTTYQKPAKKRSQVKQWTFASSDSLTFSSLQFAHRTIAENGFFDIGLVVDYGTENHSHQPIAVSATSSSSGLVSGHRWEPISIVVNATENEEFTYTVTGLIHWNLLGIKLYSDLKQYEGIIDYTVTPTRRQATSKASLIP
ncbi:hypothetical protein GCM10027347_41350 [Larkinella harenae]